MIPTSIGYKYVSSYTAYHRNFSRKELKKQSKVKLSIRNSLWQSFSKYTCTECLFFLYKICLCALPTCSDIHYVFFVLTLFKVTSLLELYVVMPWSETMMTLTQSSTPLSFRPANRLSTILSTRDNEVFTYDSAKLINHKCRDD